MPLKVQIAVSPEKVNDHDHHINMISNKINVDKNQFTAVILQKRSIDARKKKVKFNLIYEVYQQERYSAEQYDPSYKKVDDFFVSQRENISTYF